MSKDKKRKKQEPTPRKRLFTDEFRLGQRVAITRTEHGWLDGAEEGRITSMTPYSATVTTDDGHTHEINHPRDIYPTI